MVPVNTVWRLLCCVSEQKKKNLEVVKVVIKITNMALKSQNCFSWKGGLKSSSSTPVQWTGAPIAQSHIQPMSPRSGHPPSLWATSFSAHQPYCKRFLSYIQKPASLYPSHCFVNLPLLWVWSLLIMGRQFTCKFLKDFSCYVKFEINFLQRNYGSWDVSVETE